MKQDMSRAENYTPYAAYYKRWLRGGKLGVRGVSMYPLSKSNILLNEIIASKKGLGAGLVLLDIFVNGGTEHMFFYVRLILP